MALVLTASLLFPIQAHTVTELEAWQSDWSNRANQSLSPELVSEFADMRSRHLWYFDPQPEPEVQISVRVVTRVGAYSADVEQWRPLIGHFWPPEHVDRMMRILRCESLGVPTAINPRSGTAGLLQIHPLWQKVWPGDYLDPWTNAAVAYQVWLEQGYRAWACKGHK